MLIFHGRMFFLSIDSDRIDSQHTSTPNSFQTEWSSSFHESHGENIFHMSGLSLFQYSWSFNSVLMILMGALVHLS